MKSRSRPDGVYSAVEERDKQSSSRSIGRCAFAYILQLRDASEQLAQSKIISCE